MNPTPNPERGQARTLYLDTTRVDVRMEGGAIRLQRSGRARMLIPPRRISRAMVVDHDDGLVQACLAVVAGGGTVHFQHADGTLRAVLQAPWNDGDAETRRFAGFITHSLGLGVFHRWRDNQRQHAWSLVFRHGYCGDFNANRHRLIRYLLFFRPEIDATTQVGWLEQQLWAWLQAQMDRDHLRPVILALHDKGEDLGAALRPCLLIPLIWAWVRWQREASGFITDRLHFFELQAATRMHAQYFRHVNALRWEYERASMPRAHRAYSRHRPAP
ncbi:MAG TPA: hypothetical protein VF265_01960 [Nevskiaceae bacterium]